MHTRHTKCVKQSLELGQYIVYSRLNSVYIIGLSTLEVGWQSNYLLQYLYTEQEDGSDYTDI